MRSSFEALVLAGVALTASCAAVVPTYTRRREPAAFPSALASAYTERRAGLDVAVTPATTAYVTTEIPTIVTTEPKMAVPIDLSTVLSLAGEKPNTIRRATERVAQAEASMDGAWARLLPNAILDAPNFEVHHGWQQLGRFKLDRDPGASSTGGSGGTISRRTLAYNGQRFFVGFWQLAVDVNYFDAAFLIRERARQRDAANFMREQVTINTIARAAELYFALAQFQRLMESARQNVRHGRELEKKVEARVAIGVDVKMTLDEVQAELSRVLRTLAQHEAQFLTASSALATLLRLDPTIVLFVPGHAVETLRPVTFVSLDTPMDSLIDTALGQRADHTAAMLEVSAAEQNTTAATYGPFVPWLRAGMFGRDGPLGIEGYKPDSTLHGRQDYVVALEWHFDGLGFGNYARYKESKARLRATNVELDDLRERIMHEVIEAHQHALYWSVELDHAVKRFEAAGERLHVVQETHEQGKLTMSDVLEANRVRNAAAFDIVRGIASYNAAQYKLLAVLGERPGH